MVHNVNKHFSIKVLDEDAVQPKVYVRHYDGANVLTHDCIPRDETNFICRMGGKFIVVEGEAIVKGVVASALGELSCLLSCSLFVIFKCNIFLLEISWEKYIGCFKSQRTLIDRRNVPPSTCTVTCRTPFFGTNNVCDYFKENINVINI